MNKDNFEVMRYVVVEYVGDSMVQISPSLSLENARKFIKNSRECEPKVEFYIIAVLEE